MYSLIELKTLVSSGRDPARSLPLRRGFLLIPLVLVSFAFSPQMQAQLPPEIPGNPDGCYPAFTTAEGCNALHLLGGGIGNSAFGWYANFLADDANFNTSLGAATLALTSTGADSNTAVGTAAMILNILGNRNTAVGTNALVGDPDFGNSGDFNGAVGAFSMYKNLDGSFNNAFGDGALFWNFTGDNNTAIGDDALRFNDISGGGIANNNTAVGFEALRFNIDGGVNTAVGSDALTNNTIASGSTAVGDAALLFNDFFGDGFPFGFFNGAVGAGALLSNVDGFGNNAFGESALFSNQNAAENTALGDVALANNDFSGSGLANNNAAVGGAALFSNVDGSENTAVGTGAGQNVIAGFNNTYLGDFVGTLSADESSTIRIGDLSNGNGAGSLDCFIGGIFANLQPVGGTVVEVTLDLADDHLGWDVGPSQSMPNVPSRGAPARRSAPGAPAQRPAMPNGLPTQRQAMLNDKVDKVDKLQVVVQMQQKQIVALTAQLKQQATQIDKVSAQLEMMKPAPRVVENR